MSTKYRESKDVPTSVLVSRLYELVHVITKRKTSLENEFIMRIPAELDRDADLVLCEVARRLEKYEKIINGSENGN